MSQPEALLDEGFHGTAALVGSLAFSYLVTEEEGTVKKSSFIMQRRRPRTGSCLTWKKMEWGGKQHASGFQVVWFLLLVKNGMAFLFFWPTDAVDCWLIPKHQTIGHHHTFTPSQLLREGSWERRPRGDRLYMEVSFSDLFWWEWIYMEVSFFDLFWREWIYMEVSFFQFVFTRMD